MYLELHASSAFSFLEAASLPETLIAQAARYGYPAIALLDRDGVYGAPRFHRAATAAGIKAIIGAELTIAQPSLDGTFRAPPSRWALRRQVGAASLSPQPTLLILIGGSPMVSKPLRLIAHKMRAPKGEGALTLDELAADARSIRLAGSDCWVQKYGVAD